jgi:uncharacterized membrane protein SpoIIM required for sporulation
MLSIAPVFLPLFMLCFSAMIICAVSSHWFGKQKLAVATRVLCWITGIISLPGVFVGGLGLVVLAACYTCYRVSERVRYKFRNPGDQIHPDYDKILDAGLD